MDLKLIDVKNTAGNFRPCDLGLNLLAYKARNFRFLSHGMLFFSAFTHPTDCALQAVVFTVLCPINPFITVGVNLLNKKWKRASFCLLTAPAKIVLSSSRVPFYVAFKVVQMAWGMTVNPYVNVFRGIKKNEERTQKEPIQTEAFFHKYNHRQLMAESEYRNRFDWTAKKAISLPIPENLEEFGKDIIESELSKTSRCYVFFVGFYRGFINVFIRFLPGLCGINIPQ